MQAPMERRGRSGARTKACQTTAQTQAEGDDEGAEDELAEQDMAGVRKVLMPPSHTPDQVLANGAVHPAPRRSAQPA